MARRRKNNPWKGIVAGAIGGGVATVAMTGFQMALTKAEERLERRSGNQPNGDHPQESQPESEAREPATVKAANAVSKTLRGKPVADERKSQAGQAVHYAFGVSNGIAYGVLSEFFPEVRSGYGTAFGGALWFLGDEVGVPAFELSDKPWKYPPKVHANALAAHLVYGAATYAVTQGIRKLW